VVGADSSGAVDVNERGEVIGRLGIGQIGRAFYWSEAKGMMYIGTLGGAQSTGTAINDKGLIVGGSSIAGDAESHATLWVPIRRSL
jgi:probable HAF family extracellular repeat protein